MSKLVASARSGALVRYRPKHGSKAARRRRQRATPSKAVKRQVMERDGHRCVQCGSTRELTVDHDIPVAKGGGKDIDNLVTLCAGCNHFKADKLAA